MERLTETNNCIGFMETYLNVDCKECQYKGTGECEEFKDECKAVADFKEFVKNMYSKLKDYEDLEEQGKLLKLPVPIGEEMFFIYMDCPKDYKEEYCKDHEGYCEKCPHREPKIMNRAFSLSDIQNLHKIRAYSTPEQAERALAEMEGKK